VNYLCDEVVGHFYPNRSSSCTCWSHGDHYVRGLNLSRLSLRWL